ncbi:MAG: hypothetical protein E6Q97_22835 [Desulfurellales bacterium]|nr:MAG: hypothetical protein E6Q97_22835 [Desulfurellales bacterium]
MTFTTIDKAMQIRGELTLSVSWLKSLEKGDFTLLQRFPDDMQEPLSKLAIRLYKRKIKGYKKQLAELGIDL